MQNLNMECIYYALLMLREPVQLDLKNSGTMMLYLRGSHFTSLFFRVDGQTFKIRLVIIKYSTVLTVDCYLNAQIGVGKKWCMMRVHKML